MYPDNSFGELLNLVEMNYQLACDQEAGSCGKLNYIHHFLSTLPHVFTTVLGWQNTCESTDDILATLAALTPELDIGVLYCGLDPGKKHCLVSVCPNGHTLCSNCKLKHNHCPTCRYELGNIRCLALEKVAESLELPCQYQNLGCPDVFPYYSKLKHEHLCRYMPYNCPYAGSECLVTGDIPTLVTHLKNDHKVDMHDGCTFNHRYIKSNPQEVENATWMLTVFNCFGQQFCLHFEAFLLGVAPVYMAFLRFMGDENEAKNFSYSQEVGGNGRKLTWQGVLRSIRDNHRKVQDNYDGLVIHRNMALFFSGGNRQELKLRVTGRKWKEQ